MAVLQSSLKEFRFFFDRFINYIQRYTSQIDYSRRVNRFFRIPEMAFSNRGTVNTSSFMQVYYLIFTKSLTSVISLVSRKNTTFLKNQSIELITIENLDVINQNTQIQRRISKICEWDKYHKFAAYVVTLEQIKIRTI